MTMIWIILVILVVLIDIVMILEILKTNAAMSAKLPWIIAIVVLPYLGVLIYYFLGRSRLNG